jgi:phosphoribosyl-AMP cyclohydrolase
MTSKELLEKLDFKKGNGLIPVIVQDAITKAVIMQAFANREAIEHTLKTGKGTY